MGSSPTGSVFIGVVMGEARADLVIRVLLYMLVEHLKLSCCFYRNLGKSDFGCLVYGQVLLSFILHFM